MDSGSRKILDRELWRMRFGTPRAMITSFLLLVVVASWFVAIPYKTGFVLGEVTGTMPHMGFDGVRQQIGVIVEGENRSARTRAQLLHPAKGEVICLRETYNLPLPRRGLSMTDMRFCESPNPTSKVD